MKKVKIRKFWKRYGNGAGSERGAVLIVVVVLSAVVLAIMTTMLYLVTVSTQMSGLQKRYRTAKDAALGGWEAVRQVVELQNDSIKLNAFQANLNAVGMNFVIGTSVTCQSVPDSGTAYSGFGTKIMLGSANWTGCDTSLTIKPDDAGTYDIRMELGSGQKYVVYSKIVHTVQGNTSAGVGEGVRIKSGVVSNSGELEMQEISSLYALEILSSSATNTNERAKFSVLYQY
ncbi:MAG: hypothetical protein OEW15_08360 [Nitrospirota bacterium]|nr:hypothetical protein [Nitrospirota bacterium]